MAFETIRNISKKSYIRYLFSGGIAFVAEYSVFSLMVLLSVDVVAANTTSFITGLIVSFALNKKVVFISNGRTHSQAVKYVIIALINLVISNIVIHFFVIYFDANPFLMKIITIGLIACWNYVLFSKVVFKK